MIPMGLPPLTCFGGLDIMTRGSVGVARVGCGFLTVVVLLLWMAVDVVLAGTRVGADAPLLLVVVGPLPAFGGPSLWGSVALCTLVCTLTP